MEDSENNSKVTSTDLAVRPEDDKEFRKANDAIGIRVAEGRLSLLPRKLFNTLVFHAHRQEGPGRTVPDDNPVHKNFFWVEQTDIAKDANYNSNDTERLKEILVGLQNIRIVREDINSWSSERLLSSVKILNTSPSGKQGGKVWIGYAFPPEVMNTVMQPGQYTKLSLFYTGLFKSGSALALYEIARRYATNPSKLTRSEPWQWWYDMLSGSATETDKYPLYKEFKRGLLARAISEVNGLTELSVELIEHKSGRKVIGLQFVVNENAQSKLSFPPVVDSVAIDKMVALGATDSEASDLLALYGDEKIHKTIEFVEKRMKNEKAGEPITSPLAYFRTLLKRGIDVELPSPKNPVRKAAAKSKEPISFRDRFKAERALKAFEQFAGLTPATQQEIYDEFRSVFKQNVTKVEKALQRVSIRKMLASWYADRLWGEPSDSEVLEFVERQTLRGE